MLDACQGSRYLFGSISISDFSAVLIKCEYAALFWVYVDSQIKNSIVWFLYNSQIYIYIVISFACCTWSYAVGATRPKYKRIKS